MGEEKLIQERKKKLIKSLIRTSNWIAYFLLAGIIALTVYIRTLPMSINPQTGKPWLWDITKNSWTLGPDLDPFLFLRWMKDVIEHGSVASIDYMRYVPLGYETKGEMLFHVYLMAWFHKFINLFGTFSVEYSAVVYPVFVFSLGVIAFFFMTRKIFIESMGEVSANAVALISTLLFSVTPIYLSRTIAGIPEKEASGTLFLFLAFYLFISAWKANSKYLKLGIGLLAGLATAGMALVWGGYVYIYVTIAIAGAIALFLGQVNKERYYIYAIWLFSSATIMYLASSRYTPIIMLSSVTTSSAFVVFGIMSVHFILFETKLKNKLKKYSKLEKTFEKIPKPVISSFLFLILAIIAVLVFFGPGFVPDKVNDIYNALVKPVTDRLGVTVAENRQPYFEEWKNSFGVEINGRIIPLFFWLFFIGSIYLFYRTIGEIFEKKERLILTLSYAIFLFAIVFSRYSANSVMNGENSASLIFYFLGFVILVGSFGYYYYESFKKKEEVKLKHFDFGILLLFVFFFISIVSARGAIRLIMMLAPSASIMIGYFTVATFKDSLKMKTVLKKFLALSFAFLIILATAFTTYSFFLSSEINAKYHIPNTYSQQWQKAMAWTRENTPKNAVFGHWWDYGYWVQSIGERATVLDGGNVIPYWNHLMGRHALTGSDNIKALEYLYAHNTTHFLIDPTDIGKYSAFSSIGSDINYDRYSWLQDFQKDQRYTQETKNTTKFVYTGGTLLDGDLIYNINGTRVFLPGGKAGIAGVILERNNSGELVSQPEGIYFYQQKEYRLPLRYAYVDGQFIDFGSGVDAGVFVYPRLIQRGGGYGIEKDGALIYLSNKTVKSQLARLYLYKEDNPYFKLVHSEDNFLVEQIKSQNPGYPSDFVNYNGNTFGPIRIWEIRYPEGMQVKQEYLLTKYPDMRLTIAR